MADLKEMEAKGYVYETTVESNLYKKTKAKSGYVLSPKGVGKLAEVIVRVFRQIGL
jgi:hypothetical protein